LKNGSADVPGTELKADIAVKSAPQPPLTYGGNGKKNAHHSFGEY
jgi:hypothetical protein